MSKLKLLGILVLFLIFPSQAFGSGNAQLELWKRSEFLHAACGHCASMFSFQHKINWPDFSAFEPDFGDGYFTANLNGPAGTQVTLFGLQNYGEKQGFLIIVKKDDFAIEIEDITGFTPRKWTEVKKEKGSYSAFYQPHQNFKSSVSSVKWGKWWDSSTPMSNN